MCKIFDDLTLRDAAIVSILYDERWYGDEPPHWIISNGKRWQRPSQSAAQAYEQREKIERHLYRHGINQSHVALMASSIESCRPSHRCGSGACSECTRALQRWVAENVHPAAASLLKSKKELILVSIVPDYAVTSATRPMLNWEDVITKLCEDMASVGIKRAIGGSDFSVNIDTINKREPVLQGQFWMLIEKPKGNWEELLKELINPSGTIKRPLKKSDYAGSYAQLAYGIKNEFNKRETYVISRKLRNAHMNTREKKLRGNLRLKLMLFLDHIGLERRLIDHNALSFNSQGLPQVSLGGFPNANHGTIDESAQKSVQKAISK
jgi:hypothetical protein